MRFRAIQKGALVAGLLAAWVLCPALPACAKEPVRISLSARIGNFGTPHDLALARNPLGVHQPSGIGATPEKLDYITFAHELVAFVLKEVLDESGDEYAGNSLLPSQLSHRMPETEDRFKEHCLVILGKLRSNFEPDVKEVVSPSVRSAVSTLLQTASTAFAATQIWNNLRDPARDEGSDDSVSLRPKVGTNKAMLAVTVRW